MLKNESPKGVIIYEPKINIIIFLLLKFFGVKKNFKWYARLGSQIFDERLPFIPNKVSRYLIKKLFKSIFSQVDRIIVVNSKLKNTLQSELYIQEDKVFSLPICLSHINKDEFFLADQNLYFIAAGRLEYVKGFDFLIRTFSNFIRTTNNQKIKLIIFGNGSKKNQLEKLIKQLGMNSSVVLYGYVTQPVLNSEKIISYVVPSRSEGFGKVIIEAMSAGNIVIASDCPGPIEIIAHGKDGFLFQNEDADSLLAVLSHVTYLSDNRKFEIKKEGYNKSLQYTQNKVAIKLNKLIERDFSLEKNIVYH